MKIISYTLYVLLIGLVVGIAGLLIGTRMQIPGAVEIKIVKSGSMEPAIPTGSLVVVKPEGHYAVGDVITFGKDTKTDIPTTHRIVRIDGEAITTKGDANEEVDPQTITRRDIIGRVILHAPYLGFLLDFARQPIGFVLLIAVPAGLVILEELLVIAREVHRAWRRRDDDTSGGSETTIYARPRKMDDIFVPMIMRVPRALQHARDSLPAPFGVQTALVSCLIFCATLFSGASGSTLAYFSDLERSLGNIFQAGVWTDEPIGDPQSIVINEFLPNPDGVQYGFDFGNDASNMPQGEWVELYNNGDLPIDVGGWILSDESGGVGNTQAIISSANTQPATTTVPAHGWLVVYFNKPVLNDTGDSIFLYTGTSTGNLLIDSYTYDNPSDFCDNQPSPGETNATSTPPTGTPGNGGNADCNAAQVGPNKTYARIPDGTGDFVDPIPTPGAPNILEVMPADEPSALLIPSHPEESLATRGEVPGATDTGENKEPQPTEAAGSEEVVPETEAGSSDEAAPDASDATEDLTQVSDPQSTTQSTEDESESAVAPTESPQAISPAQQTVTDVGSQNTAAEPAITEE